MASASVRAALERIANAKPSNNGVYLKPWGRYHLRLEKLLIQDGRTKQGASTVFFIAEHTVLDMEPLIDLEGIAAKDRPNPKGSSASFIADINTEVGPGNIKAYLMGLTGDPDTDFTDPDVLDEIASLDQPLKGLEVIDEAVEKAKKRSAGVFTLHKWVSLPQTEANKKHMEELKAKNSKTN